MNRILQLNYIPTYIVIFKDYNQIVLLNNKLLVAYLINNYSLR